ncbi:MAG: DUF502 domain-containing protein [Methylococcaceae bacterium]|jgi:uncharacterized membrane protein
MKEYVRKLFNYCLIGIFAVIPIVVILQIVIFVRDRISDLFQLVYGYSDNYLYTGLFFFLSFIILVLIGHKTVKEGRFWAIALFDRIIERIPLLNSIHRVVKKVLSMFSSHDNTIAKEVVYVEYPKSGLWVPAYVTNRYEDMYVLFIPTSPNPTSGFTVIADKAKVVHSTMSIEQVTSFIISVGVDYSKPGEMSELPK